MKIEGIKLHSLGQVSPSRKEDNPNRILTAVKIGNAFNIDGISIESRKGDDWFLQNWAMADARLLDVPGFHGKQKKKPVLHDILGRAVFVFCAKESNESLRAFIEKRGEVPELPFFKPKEWEGLSLRIPVEFITLRHFHYLRSGNSVVVDIQIGHHLIFWSVKIFDGKKICLSNDRISNPALSKVIKKMLRRKKVREFITLVSEIEHLDMTSEFTEAFKGYDFEKIPPVRFY